MRDTIFKFRRTDQIGAMSAEQDLDYLMRCFVDTGELSLLMDSSDRRQLVIGRTGAGKTALLTMLRERSKERAINISPESLALTYISNSTVLRFFSELGVNLDPFFKLLWRHVFTVEILTRHYQPDVDNTSLLDRLRERFLGPSREDAEARQALDYLETWGKKFWVETEYRVKEITETIENQLGAQIQASLGVPAASIATRTNAASTLSTEQKADLHTRGQQVVSAAQVQDLQKVSALLDKVLDAPQKQYYVVIDSLDENWVEEQLRYKLIMALILTATEFIRIHNAKIVVALRRDLIERVFRLTRSSGFQEEKYQSLYLPLSWTNKQLLHILDKRVDALVSRRYTKQRVTHKDLLPHQFEKFPISTYICRIATQPRDIIALFNTCILAAPDCSKLDAGRFKIAVGEYSRTRLRALGDEWSADYPCLLTFAKLLQRRTSSFNLDSISNEEVEELCLDLVASDPGDTGILKQHARQLVDCVINIADFKAFLIQVFYKTGLVGLKLEPHERVSWSDETGRSVSAAEVSPDVSIAVQPKYHRALGIKP